MGAARRPVVGAARHQRRARPAPAQRRGGAPLLPGVGRDPRQPVHRPSAAAIPGPEEAAMATEFQMPKLGLTMEAGTIIGWHVANGALVEMGTPVLAIETDKVETDVEASASGRLHQVGAPGDTFACGERIGWFLAEGEEAPAAPTSSASTVPASPVAGVAGERPVGTDPGSPAAAPPLSPASRAGDSLPAGAAGEQPTSGQDGRIRSSPNARRVAVELGVDIAAVAGSGPGGRIVAADVQRFVETRLESVSRACSLPSTRGQSPSPKTCSLLSARGRSLSPRACSLPSARGRRRSPIPACRSWPASRRAGWPTCWVSTSQLFAARGSIRG